MLQTWVRFGRAMTQHVLLDLNKWETYIHLEHIYIIIYIYMSNVCSLNRNLST